MTSPPMFLAPCPHLSSIQLTPSFCTAYSAEPSVVSSTFCCSRISPDLSCHCLKYLTRRASSGELTTRPFLNSASGSIPTTFSPMTTMMPEMAPPAASPSQFVLAMSVEPKAPVNTGTSSFILNLPCPTSVPTLTAGNMALSGSAFTPLAPTHVP